MMYQFVAHVTVFIFCNQKNVVTFSTFYANEETMKKIRETEFSRCGNGENSLYTEVSTVCFCHRSIYFTFFYFLSNIERYIFRWYKVPEKHAY